MPRGEFDIEKNRIAKSLRFDIPNVPFGVGHCVYKLYYGDRYIINKGEQLAASLLMVQNGYANHVAYGQSEADDKKNKLFIQFYRYIQKHPDLKFRLEILLKSDNAYQILKREQQELNGAINDKKCLNSEITPYIPKWRPQTQTWGSWINKSQYLNFRKFQKNNS